MQDLPRPEALESKTVYNTDSLNQVKETADEEKKIDEVNNELTENEDNNNENAEDLSGDAEKVHIRLPLELDLSDLAGALLMNNQQCVISTFNITGIFSLTPN